MYKRQYFKQGKVKMYGLSIIDTAAGNKSINITVKVKATTHTESVSTIAQYNVMYQGPPQAKSFVAWNCMNCKARSAFYYVFGG